MDWKDLIVTPIYLVLIYLFLYFINGMIRNPQLRQYFLPAFTFKVIGAIALGLIYQFYYGGGDTFNYYLDCSKMWDIFTENPAIWIQMLFTKAGNYDVNPLLYNALRKIYFFQDPTSYLMVQFGTVISIFTFNTYSTMAISYALLSFSGAWALFQTLCRMYPHLHWQFALSLLFLPSIFFWSSGFMKDTLTFGALGWLFYSLYGLFIKRESFILNIIIIMISIYIIRSIKVYILLSFLPSFFFWIFLHYRKAIRSQALRLFITPILLSALLPLALNSIQIITAEDERYQLDNLVTTTQVSAEWIKYSGQQDQGSVYDLGDFDGSLGNLLIKFPQAVWLCLFRPYIWEARNPVMLLSALEATFFLLLSFYVLFTSNPLQLIKTVRQQPFIIFCLVFSISFGFGVAIATYNFGSLARYKIPLLPFYLVAIFILQYYGRDRKAKAST